MCVCVCGGGGGGIGIGMSNVTGLFTTENVHQIKSITMSPPLSFRFLCVTLFGFSSCFGTCECFPGTDSKASRNREGVGGGGDGGGRGQGKGVCVCGGGAADVELSEPFGFIQPEGDL